MRSHHPEQKLLAAIRGAQFRTKTIRGLRIDSKDGTLTGNIEFDQNGQRKRYDVNVIDLVSNTKATFNSKEVMAWRQGEENE